MSDNPSSFPAESQITYVLPTVVLQVAVRVLSARTRNKTLLLLQSKQATSDTFDGFLHALVTPRPDPTKTFRLFLQAAKAAYVTPCIDICKGFCLSLSELVAVSQHARFLEIPLDASLHDFRVAFRRRCSDIDLFYCNSRLPPDGDYGAEIKDALLSQFTPLVLNLDEPILEYVLSTLGDALTTFERDTLTALLRVCTAIQRQLPRRGMQKLQARPPPPPPPWSPEAKRVAAGLEGGGLQARTKTADTALTVSSTATATTAGRATGDGGVTPDALVIPADNAGFLSAFHAALQPLTDPDALMTLSEERLSKISFLRRRERADDCQRLIRKLEMGLRDAGSFLPLSRAGARAPSVSLRLCQSGVGAVSCATPSQL